MPRKPKPLSPAERQKSAKSANRAKTLRRTAKMRELGYVPRQLWSKPQHWDAIVEFALRVNLD